MRAVRFGRGFEASACREIQKSELTALAAVGALNFISGRHGFHRRDALWQVERAARRPGPLLETPEEASSDGAAKSAANPIRRFRA